MSAATTTPHPSPSWSRSCSIRTCSPRRTKSCRPASCVSRTVWKNCAAPPHRYVHLKYNVSIFKSFKLSLTYAWRISLYVTISPPLVLSAEILSCPACIHYLRNKKVVMDVSWLVECLLQRVNIIYSWFVVDGYTIGITPSTIMFDIYPFRMFWKNAL